MFERRKSIIAQGKPSKSTTYVQQREKLIKIVTLMKIDNFKYLMARTFISFIKNKTKTITNEIKM